MDFYTGSYIAIIIIDGCIELIFLSTVAAIVDAISVTVVTSVVTGTTSVTVLSPLLFYSFINIIIR